MRTLLLVLLLSLAALAQESTLRLVQWSDIHSGGPNYDPTALAQARVDGLAFRPDAFLITGDNGDNGEDPGTFAPRLAAFLKSLAADLRSVRVPVIWCLGNNDFADNYQSDPPLLEQTQRLFQAAFGARYYLNQLGNGVLPARPGGQRWISLNSQIFSRKNRYAGANDQSTQTLAWLRAQLQGKDPVVLVMHIPPTWDFFDGKSAWRVECLRPFLQVLRDYPGPVTIVAGHYHRNQVQGIRRTQGDVPILISSSLSTKYEYEPNWRSYLWKLRDGAPRVFDYALHYPGRPGWQQHYRVEGLEEFARRLDDPTFYRQFVLDLMPHSPEVKARTADPAFKAQYLREYWVDADLAP